MKRRGFFQDGTGERRVRFFIIIIFFFSLEQVTFWDLEDEKGEVTNLGGGQERKVFFFFFFFFGAEGILQFDGESGIHRKRENLSGASG